MSSVVEEETEVVLQREEPLTRRSLADERVVRALWELAGEERVSQNCYGVAQIFRAFEHNNVHVFEVATAMEFHGLFDCPDKRVSLAFEDMLARESS